MEPSLGEPRPKASTLERSILRIGHLKRTTESRGENETQLGALGWAQANLRHGRGKFSCAADNKVFVGEFDKGLKQGPGKLLLPTGDHLLGQWDSGEITGNVEFVFANDSAWHNAKL